MKLSGKKALVTGGSRGIGRAIAALFAREGADVAVTSRRLEALAEVVADIEAAGRVAVPLEWDVRDVAIAETRLAEASERLGGLDIVVNNAGVLGLPPDHPNPSEEATWDYVLDTNLKGLYFLSQAAAKLLTKRGGGVILNLASDAGVRGAANPYGVSKWGVVGFTKGLAKQLAPHGVRVNAVAPGPAATEMMNWRPGRPMESPGLPLGRYALPEEIASVALFLAADDSRAVFGQTIVVNSGND